MEHLNNKKTTNRNINANSATHNQNELKQFKNELGNNK